MSSITYQDVNKMYPNGVHAVTGLNIHIDSGEFIVLVGPSGCGKTTALRMLTALKMSLPATFISQNRE
jgi:multiple sugar transport system ATP-binding protein